MDASLFSEALMQLDDRLLNRPLAERLSYDADRNTLFLGLDGYRVHTEADVEAIRAAILEVFHRVGHRFSAVINYDSSDIASHMADKWFSMAADVERTCYDSCLALYHQRIHAPEAWRRSVSPQRCSAYF